MRQLQGTVRVRGEGLEMERIPGSVKEVTPAEKLLGEVRGAAGFLHTCMDTLSYSSSMTMQDAERQEKKSVSQHIGFHDGSL